MIQKKFQSLLVQYNLEIDLLYFKPYLLLTSHHLHKYSKTRVSPVLRSGKTTSFLPLFSLTYKDYPSLHFHLK